MVVKRKTRTGGKANEIPASVIEYLDIQLQKRTLYSRLEEYACDAAPEAVGGVLLDDLRKYYLALPVGFLYVAAFAGILIGLTTIGVQNTITSKYLSLSKLDSGATCKEVPAAQSGIYRGTWDGYWNTQAGYDPSKSLFVLEFSGANVGNLGFSATMGQFAHQLNRLGRMAESRNTAWAQMVYASYSFTSVKSNMKFYSSADAKDIFFQQLLTATISGHNGTCNSYATTGRRIDGSFDYAYSQLVAKVPLAGEDKKYLTYIGESLNTTKRNMVPETCPDIVQLNRMLYNPSTAANKAGDALIFNFDINSIISAISLNLGIVNTTNLVRTTVKLRTKEVGGYTPIKYFDKIRAYFDPNSFSPDLSPLYCYDKVALGAEGVLTPEQVAGPEICFLGSHNPGQDVMQLFYPTMSQVANNPYKTDSHGNLKMDPCQCPDQKYSAYCNYQDVIWGMVFDSGNSTYTGRLHEIAFKAQSFMLGKTFGGDPVNGDILAQRYFEEMLGYSANVDYARDTSNQKIGALSKDQFNAATGAKQTKGVGNAWAGGKSYNQLLKASWAKICPWGTCAAFVFETYADMTNFGYQGLNKFHVQMAEFSNITFVDANYTSSPNALHKLQMCTDTITMAAAMAKLSLVPPIPLVQSYYECTPTTQSAFIAAFGSAVGSATLFLQLGTLVVGNLIIWVANYYLTRRKKERLLPKAERLDVLDQYEILKTQALCDMLKASVESFRALRAAHMTHDNKFREMHELLLNRIDEMDKKVTNLPGLGHLATGAQMLGQGALHAVNQLESAVEDEVRRGMMGESTKYGPGEHDDNDHEHEPGDSKSEASTAASAIVGGTEDDKRREHIEKLMRSEDDVVFYENMLVKRYERVKLLYNIEDITLEAEEAELVRRHGQGAEEDGEGKGDEGEGEWDNASSSDGGDSAAGAQGGLLGGVSTALSFINPFSYVGGSSSSGGGGSKVTSPEEAARIQMSALPKAEHAPYLYDPATDPGSARHLSSPVRSGTGSGHGPGFGHGHGHGHGAAGPGAGQRQPFVDLVPDADGDEFDHDHEGVLPAGPQPTPSLASFCVDVVPPRPGAQRRFLE